jgi:hypothetical protein
MQRLTCFVEGLLETLVIFNSLVVFCASVKDVDCARNQTSNVGACYPVRKIRLGILVCVRKSVFLEYISYANGT